jgi:hypothetical protein
VPHDGGGKGLHFHSVSEEVNGRQDRHYSTPFHSDDGAITGVELAIVCVQRPTTGVTCHIRRRYSPRRGDRIEILFAAVHESAYGTTRTFRNVCYSVAIGWKADIIGSL